MRIALVLAAILSAFFGPPALTLLCMVILAVRYAAWETLLIGFLVDCLWFPQSAGLFGFIPLFTLAGILLTWGLEPLRREFLVE